MRPHLLVVLYLLHHVCDGSSQIVEGRTWFKIIEIKIRRGENFKLSQNFWVIYTLAQNFQLLLGQIFIWAALGITAEFSPALTAPAISITVVFRFLLCRGSKIYSAGCIPVQAVLIGLLLHAHNTGHPFFN